MTALSRCRTVVLVATIALPLLACRPADPRERGDRPVHVVLYVIDTLRRDRLGLYGYERGTSPVIDALARESVVFDHAYAAAPWTLPSMVSLMTSTYPVDHRVLHSGQKLAPDFPTLPVRLGQIGYRTAGFNMNPHAGDYAGLRRGYDHYAVTAGAPFVGQWLNSLAAEPAGSPLFIYHHTTEPHRPFRAPTEFAARFGAVSDARRERINQQTLRHLDLLRVDRHSGRRVGSTDNSRRQDVVLEQLGQELEAVNDLYDASVAWGDANLGLVIDVLKQAGIWDDTLLIVTSDHGEELLDHGGVGHAQSVYDELVRVPLLWRFPGGAAGGRRIEQPVSLVDLLPTLMAYLDHPELSRGDLGRDLLPAMLDGAPPPDGPLVTSVRVNRDLYYRPAKLRSGDVNVSVIEDGWKGVWNVETRRFELYDRSADPAESRDRRADAPEVAKRLRTAAERWLAERPREHGASPAPTPAQPGSVDEATAERLRMLGYLDPSEAAPPP